MDHPSEPEAPPAQQTARARRDASRPAGRALPDAPATDAADATHAPTELQLAAAADTFAMLASPARLHLVQLMSSGHFDVGALAAQVGLSLPTTSQHLSKLRLAGIVSARREGRHSFYTVEDPHVLSLVEQIFEHIAPDGTLAPDPPIKDSRA
ncbi:ArsR/SmtB family transcription factor [Brachybacterium alimentarium]|uniref:ArsR/SmtB family transcription factor n=1 Tax=Brachybacterium alimentarium TaxID=47845 RepID=UPI000DF335A4|nr:transcriptional regulator [Brachybacterium alimentarium]RCS87376.1 transcriptional regulator [Brachybacterium alimentarium]